MAKIVGLVGAVSGKVGNFVGAVVGGVQTMRVYQPIVANPRTTGQVKQRGRVNLAGQLTSVITRAAIEGLPGNARQRRSALNKKLIDAVSEAGNIFSLQGEKLVFSLGNKAGVLSFEFNYAQKSQDNTVGASITIVKYSDNVDIARVILLAVPKPIVSGEARSAAAVVDVQMTGGSVVFEDEFPVVGDPLNYNLFAYVVPMVIDNRSALTLGYLNSLADTGVIKLDGSVATSGAFAYGNSQYVGVKSVAQP